MGCTPPVAAAHPQHGLLPTAGTSQPAHARRMPCRHQLTPAQPAAAPGPAAAPPERGGCIDDQALPHELRVVVLQQQQQQVPGGCPGQARVSSLCGFRPPLGQLSVHPQRQGSSPAGHEHTSASAGAATSTCPAHHPMVPATSMNASHPPTWSICMMIPMIFLRQQQWQWQAAAAVAGSSGRQHNRRGQTHARARGWVHHHGCTNRVYWLWGVGIWILGTQRLCAPERHVRQVGMSRYTAASTCGPHSPDFAGDRADADACSSSSSSRQRGRGEQPRQHGCCVIHPCPPKSHHPATHPYRPPHYPAHP